MILNNFAIGFWINNQNLNALALMAFNAVVFRCDMVIFALPLMLDMLIFRNVKFNSLLKAGFISSFVSIFLTAIIDSFFWNQKRLVWPELEVLYFNTILNKSSEWGTSPFHWYFSSAIPRSLLLFVLCLPLSLLSSITKGLRWINRKNISVEVSKLFWPFFAFLALYSFLPHKELRFILPIIPTLNFFAALGILKTEAFLTKEVPRLRRFIYALFLINAFLSGAFFFVSYHNYPGGNALQSLHSKISHSPRLENISIHICDLAATTGVSRFLEIEGISYNKTDITPSCCDFTHVLAENENLDGFAKIDSEYAFAGFSKSWPFIRLQPQIHILQKSKIHCKCKISFQ
jgi:alpha-1,6-mannosyltransferase